MSTIIDEPIPIEIKRKLIKPLAPQIPSVQRKIDEELKKVYRKQQKQERKLEVKRLKKERYEAKQERANIPFVRQPRRQRQVRPVIRITINPALDNNVIEITYHNTTTTNPRFIDELIRDLANKIIERYNLLGRIRIQLRGEVLLHRGIDVNDTMTWYHTNHIITINNIRNIEELLRTQINRLYQEVEEAGLEGSDWVVDHFTLINAYIMSDPIMRGSSYIDLPKVIKDKKAVLNIQNKQDNECFKWCILAHLNPIDAKKHPQRVSNYNNLNHNLNFTNIPFPVKIKDIPKFEQLNNISINVFGYDIHNNDPNIYGLYISKFNYPTLIELLYVESENINEQQEKDGHYTLIRNFNRLYCGSVGVTTGGVLICRRCMNTFYSQESYDKHNYYCINMQPRCIMPKENEIIKFKNINNKLRHPLAIYADLESLLVPLLDKFHHVVSSASFVTVGCISKFKLYRGENCMEEFVNGIKEIITEFSSKQQQFRRAIMTTEDYAKYNSSTKCWICNTEFNSTIQKLSSNGNTYYPKSKVVDHDHVTGKYIGAAHHDCNFKRKTNKFVPIAIHNLSGYDSHMIVKILNKFGDGQIKIIPKTEEEYISFSKIYQPNENDQYDRYEIRFIDSYRFLAASLDALSTNLLKEDKNKFQNLLKFTTKEEQDTIFWEERIETRSNNLIMNDKFDVEYKNIKSVEFKPRIKGIYPYEFTDSWEKFNHTEILSKEDFYDNLNQKEINNQEYEQYLRVWNLIPDCNLGKYSDLYLKTDVLALADVMENFRDIALKHYELDPIYYYTTPGYSFDACLKMTNINLDMLTDYRMLQIIEHGMRGGISSVLGDRYVNVEGKNYITNPIIPKDDPLQEWLLYVDANNLYGWAMSKKLPTGNFKWEENYSEIDSMIRNNTYDDGDIGYILNVDLVVPKTERFMNYPLAPESKSIAINQLSDYSKKLLEGQDSYTEVDKLMLDFTDKKNYTIHISNLILYHKLGCEFKINEVISFSQSNWLQIYIDLNTSLRKKAKNDFEKDFFKLMNNAMFGKTMEAIRERIDIKLANNWKQAAYYIKKPTYNKLRIFDEHLISIHMRKNKIVFNKPIYVGFCVLELSKYLMYETYYNKIQPMFKDVKLLYSDCDSFVLHITDSNIYKIMKENNELFDFSDYPKNHILYNEDNKKVLGKFKDECNGNIMTKRVTLRSKMYAHTIFNSVKEEKKAKGIKKCNVRNELNFQKYYDCLFNQQNTTHSYKQFKSVNHELYTITTVKKGLSSFDSKRYYLDNIHSVPFGYSLINNNP